MPFGRILLGVSGYPIFALNGDPKEADWKPGGITVDWTTVTAVGADTVLADGSTIKNGQKYLRWGQVMVRANTAAVQTVTWTGGPTAGGAILELPAFGDNPTLDTASIAFNATAAAFQAALEALSSVGTDSVSVGRTGTGTNADPYIFTVTFARNLGVVPVLTSPSNTFTGGTSPSVTIVNTTPGTGTGLFGPYDPNATDGRQTLVRGECFVINELATQFPTIGFGQPNADNPGCFDGGRVWKDRILATVGAHSLSDGPTFAEFETAFPRIGYAEN